MSKILVVDENEANLTVLENILQKEGMKPSFAAWEPVLWRLCRKNLMIYC